jgi:hypothetical protein
MLLDADALEPGRTVVDCHLVMRDSLAAPRKDHP